MMVKEKLFSVQEDLLWKEYSVMSLAISNYQDKPETARITTCIQRKSNVQERAGGEKQTTAESPEICLKPVFQMVS